MKTKKNQILLMSLMCGALFMFNSCDKDNLLPYPDGELNGKQIDNNLLAKGGKSFASGQGALMINDRVQHFSFHASVDGEGNVSGSWESKSPGQDIRTHGSIDCLTFLDDNTAILSGTITKTNDNPFGIVAGMSVWFKVIDNGEGAKNATDQFTDYYLMISLLL